MGSHTSSNDCWCHTRKVIASYKIQLTNICSPYEPNHSPLTLKDVAKKLVCTFTLYQLTRVTPPIIIRLYSYITKSFMRIQELGEVVILTEHTQYYRHYCSVLANKTNGKKYTLDDTK